MVLTERQKADITELLEEFLQPENRQRLERFRFHGSTNQVYRIPVPGAPEEFVIVKLLPNRWKDVYRHWKRAFRNYLYGEHDPSVGRKRAELEKERIREWQREGLNVPDLIEVPFPNVRVFQGLPYPTFYSILVEWDQPAEKRLEVLAAVTRALSHQHRLALDLGRKSLVQRDAGPWNTMVDPATNTAYWFDLEHPADYPKMSLEELLVHAVRLFLHGVLAYTGDVRDAAVRTFISNYELKFVLWRYVESMERQRHSVLHRLVRRLRNNQTSVALREGLLEKMRADLEAAEAPAGEATSVADSPDSRLARAVQSGSPPR